VDLVLNPCSTRSSEKTAKRPSVDDVAKKCVTVNDLQLRLDQIHKHLTSLTLRLETNSKSNKPILGFLEPSDAQEVRRFHNGKSPSLQQEPAWINSLSWWPRECQREGLIKAILRLAQTELLICDNGINTNFHGKSTRPRCCDEDFDPNPLLLCNFERRDISSPWLRSQHRDELWKRLDSGGNERTSALSRSQQDGRHRRLCEYAG